LCRIFHTGPKGLFWDVPFRFHKTRGVPPVRFLPTGFSVLPTVRLRWSWQRIDKLLLSWRKSHRDNLPQKRKVGWGCCAIRPNGCSSFGKKAFPRYYCDSLSRLNPARCSLYLCIEFGRGKKKLLRPIQWL